MELGLLIAEQIASMALMIGVGILLVKRNIIKKEAGRYLSRIVLNVILPCTIINAFQIQYDAEIAKGLFLAFAAAAACNLLLILESYLFRKIIGLSAVEQASLAYPNSGEILIPLVASVLSKELQIYCCAFLTVQIVFIFTHGIVLISGENGFNFNNILKNVNVIAILVALVLFLGKIPLPQVVVKTINSFAGMVAPACMLVIGMAIGSSEIKPLFTEKRNFLICFLRLIVMPGTILLLLKASKAAYCMAQAKEILLVVFMASATSTAATVANIAQSCDRDANKAAAINVLGTVLLIVSLPLMVMLYQAMI